LSKYQTCAVAKVVMVTCFGGSPAVAILPRLERGFSMFRRFLCSGVCLVVAWSATVCSAQVQRTFVPVALPDHGLIRPLADGSGVLYVGEGDETDSFSFAVEDGTGTSWISVDLDPRLDQSYISCVTWDGVVVSGVSSGVLFGSSKDHDSGCDPAPSPPTTQPDPLPEMPIIVEGYIVVIHVDQPGDGGDRDAWEGSIVGFDVGHAFIEVINGNTGESSTVGLYPDRMATPLNPTAPGQIRDDGERDEDVIFLLPITEEQHNELIEAIARDRQNPPQYDLNENNCVDYVIDLLNDIGIEIESTVGTWPGGSGHNPGDFGEDLIQMGARRVHP
jgi:hypothetical protein